MAKDKPTGTRSTADKLQLKPGRSFRVIAGPADAAALVGPHSATELSQRSKAPADVTLLFVHNREQLEDQLAETKERMSDVGILWIAYPKGTSKAKADINRDTIREFAATVGLEAVAIVALDDVWSALRLKRVD